MGEAAPHCGAATALDVRDGCALGDVANNDHQHVVLGCAAGKDGARYARFRPVRRCSRPQKGPRWELRQIDEPEHSPKEQWRATAMLALTSRGNAQNFRFLKIQLTNTDVCI